MKSKEMTSFKGNEVNKYDYGNVFFKNNKYDTNEEYSNVK